MAIKLIANYSKKVGLPGYSSVNFALTVETEVSHLREVDHTSRHLYELLQLNVDRQIQNPGFVPEASFGMDQSGQRSLETANRPEAWSCSPKQRNFIFKLMDDHKIDMNAIEEKSRLWHALSVKALNKLQASAFIADLIDVYGGKGGSKRASRPTTGSRG